MSDDPTELPPHEGDLLAYDFYKHMSSLSLVALGGVLTIGGTVFGQAVSQRMTLLASLLIALSGVVAFKGMVDIVRARNGQQTRLALARHGIKLVAALFGGGIGGFLYVLAVAVY